MLQIDLNSDLGEGYGNWRSPYENKMLDIVSSANIACGFHAGDPDIMKESIVQAQMRGVAIGAHPGYLDLKGMGRRRQEVHVDEIRNLIRYQLGALQAIAKAEGAHVGHLKLHGALANQAAEDQNLAEAAFGAALDVDPDLVIYVIALSAQERAAQRLGCAYASEIFADRAYEPDGALRDRRFEDAMIHDPETAALRMKTMLKEHAIIDRHGARLPASIQTICVHGDSPNALTIAQAVHTMLLEQQYSLKPCRA